MSESESSVIKTEDLWKIYHMGPRIEVPVVRGVNLTLAQNEFVSIVGFSGAGKSTLLHLLGCLDTPTRGEIYFYGRKISRLSESERTYLRCQEIGFVFQTFNLLPTLTALSNIEIAMRLANVKRAKRKTRSRSLLKIVGLEQRAKHYPNELSGGERQRVAIARALANRPKLVLADEPTGNLDSTMGAEIVDLLKQINETGTAILMVTHNQEMAKRTTKTYYMKDGSLSAK
ncbi:MAG: ABC transporter ATP-binding protein [Candidatus Thorarchaeota archaeon]